MIRVFARIELREMQDSGFDTEVGLDRDLHTQHEVLDDTRASYLPLNRLACNGKRARI